MENTENKSDKKRLRSNSKEKKMIQEKYGSVKLLFKDFTTILNSIIILEVMNIN